VDIGLIIDAQSIAQIPSSRELESHTLWSVIGRSGRGPWTTGMGNAIETKAGGACTTRYLSIPLCPFCALCNYGLRKALDKFGEIERHLSR
jgi:hypothetical protein